MKRLILHGLCPLLLIGSIALAADDRPVTQEQFKTSVRYLKSLNERLEKLEKSSGKTPDAANANELDLSKADASSSNAATRATHSGSGATPNFKTYFDLNTTFKPARQGALSFENYHALLFLEMAPNSNLQFSFDVGPTPRFYELDYQLTPQVQLRAGRIWIPFDDMSPHNIFGGRVNVSTLTPGGDTFLPDIWTDLGVGAKVDILDSESIKLVGHGYVVNGFQGGGKDPKSTVADYPQFGTNITTSDNNRDKGMGGRVHALFGQMFGIGGSFYTARWNDQNNLQAHRLTIIGGDTQLRMPTGTEIRSGLAAMSVGIPIDTSGLTTLKRAGVYGEFGQKLGSEQRFKALARVGKIQLDDRVIDSNDQTIVGGTVLYKPSAIEFSLHHSRDLQRNKGAANANYSAFRIIIAL